LPVERSVSAAKPAAAARPAKRLISFFDHSNEEYVFFAQGQR